VAACLIALSAFGFAAQAAETGPSSEQAADWEARLEKAAALQAEGKTHQAEAERIYNEADTACFKKFLVNSCRADARKIYVAASRVGKNLENEGKAIERQVKKEQLSDKDARRAAEAPQRAADLELRRDETMAARDEAAAKEAATRTDKEKKAAEGVRRKAAEAEKLRKKQAEHDARVAEKMQKAQRKADQAAETHP
jgi:colicin import membrane protein